MKVDVCVEIKEVIEENTRLKAILQNKETLDKMELFYSYSLTNLTLSICSTLTFVVFIAFLVDGYAKGFTYMNTKAILWIAAIANAIFLSLTVFKVFTIEQKLSRFK